MEHPDATLYCARVLRVFLIFFITISTFGLIVGFVLKGKLENPMVTEGQKSIDAPSVVFCPSPWGSFFNTFQVNNVQEGIIPGGDWHAIPYEVHKFNNSLVYKDEKDEWGQFK